MELASLLPIVAIALVFWLLLIRPANRRQKQAQRLQSSLAEGDRVMLSSGILGTVVGFSEDDRAYLAIADGVVIEVVRGAVARVVQPAAEGEAEGGAEEPTPGEA